MSREKVCVHTGAIGHKEMLWLEKYAAQGFPIALMDKNKQKGQRIKKELERAHHVSVFFFHGDVESEEDRDLFQGALQEIFRGMEYIFCSEM